MIAVLPTNPAGRLLKALVAHPGQLTADDLGMILFRPKLTSSESYLAHRCLILQNQSHWRKTAASLLHRLQQQGLVLPCLPPQLGPAYDPAASYPKAVEVLLERLVQDSPSTMQQWVGSAPAGNTQRTLSQMQIDRLFIHPLQRQPSMAAISLVSSWLLLLLQILCFPAISHL